ncbi:hypothetical protein QZH41_007276 [Actinostola sp. cb2023]|nr:hypothetical protein QZH41_007276 [Actinostola sp. cb2023]
MDPLWTPGHFREQFNDSSDNESEGAGDTAAITTFNSAMEMLSKVAPGHNVEPLTFQLKGEWNSASLLDQEHCINRAKEACNLVCHAIAPDEGEKLFQNLQNTHANAIEETDLPGNLVAMIAAYKNAPTSNLKTQILSIYAYEYTSEKLKRFHEPFEKLSDRKIKRAREHARTVGPGLPVEKKPSHRIRIDMTKLDHFLTFVNRPYFYQDVTYGNRTLKLDNGERLSMPNIIRTVTRSTMITQYLQYCKEDGFEPLSRATLYRVLEVREASQRKSLQGLDNTAADGTEGFHRLITIVDELESNFGADKIWCNDMRRRLKAGRRYLKTTYRVHCRDESDLCPDHCRKYALSDPSDSDFQEFCTHDHFTRCNDCEDLKETIQSIENMILMLAKNMYNSEQCDDFIYDFSQAKVFIFTWKAHVLRSENQEEAKQTAVASLKDDSIMIVMDWAMKFVQMRHREKQSEWFAKRGINWHVSSVLSKNSNGQVEVSYYAHLVNSCSQDWFAVTSIVEQLLTMIHSEKPHISTVVLRSDEAGCYHNSQLLAALRDVGERVGISIARYDYSEPQFGKDICDRILCPMKGAIRRYCNEGHDILSAQDMHTALKERNVKGSTAAVCEIRPTEMDLEITKLQGMSAFHNFVYEKNDLRVWKAFGVGPGKVVPWKSIYHRNQSETRLEICENYGFFPPSPRRIKTDSRVSEDPIPEATVFECPDIACSQAFTDLESAELHACLERHSEPKPKSTQEKQESIYDTLRRGWVEQFASLSLADEASCATRTAGISREDKQYDLLPCGWALQKPRTTSRFTEKVKCYLLRKFEVGEKTGRKADPQQVVQDIRTARDELGNRLFSRDEWLTKSQIQGYFSRLTSSRRKQLSADPLQENDEENWDENEKMHQEIVQTVVNELCANHPIMYDIYDLCEYSHQDNLKKFNVKMLQNICEHFDLPFKRKTLKAELINTIKTMVGECSCSST